MKRVACGIVAGAIGLGLFASAARSQSSGDPAKVCFESPNDPRCAGYIGAAPGAGVETGDSANAQDSSDRNSNGRFVVFLHTGGGDRNPAVKLAEILKQRGLTIGGMDDKQDSARYAGVDYFSPDDSVMAANVADTVNQILPPELAGLKTRFQKVRNPVGFLGVWFYSVQGDPKTWSARKPDQAWCYQERKAGDKPFFVACHLYRVNCETARGTNNPTPGTGCVFIDLKSADWRPIPGGYLNSWRQNSDSMFPPPFPQM
jgi:hypothetical protein